MPLPAQWHSRYETVTQSRSARDTLCAHSTPVPPLCAQVTTAVSTAVFSFAKRWGWGGGEEGDAHDPTLIGDGEDVYLAPEEGEEADSGTKSVTPHAVFNDPTRQVHQVCR